MPIVVENLKYVYLPGTPFEHTALSDVSFEIADGEYVGVIGHTGSGKSTLIQLIAQLIAGAEGRILINGIDYAKKGADKNQLRRTVGVVFQYPEYQLFEETVEKDIAFGPRKLKMEESGIESRVRAAMELVGLDYNEYRNCSPFELSGGQKRKVAIAGVLATDPKILIMDEPIAGLDPMGRKGFMELTKNLNECGITILMISHNMDDLAEYASRLLVLSEGRLIYNDAPAAVFAHEAELLSAGLDLPEAAKIANALRARGMSLPAGIISFEALKNAILAQKRGGRA